MIWFVFLREKVKKKSFSKSDEGFIHQIVVDRARGALRGARGWGRSGASGGHHGELIVDGRSVAQEQANSLYIMLDVLKPCTKHFLVFFLELPSRSR